MTIGIKKIININLFIQIFLCLISDVLYSINTYYNILFFVPDLLNVVNVMLLIMLKRGHCLIIKKRSDHSLIIGGIFLLYIACSILWSKFNLYNAVVRYRYIFSGFLMYYLCRYHLTEKNHRRIIDMMYLIHIINLFLTMYQFFALKVPVDFCNGIFGFTEYNNAGQGIYCLAISIVAIVNCIDGNNKRYINLAMLGISFIVCALAEIKIYFVVIIICSLFIFIARCGDHKKRKKIIFMIFIGLLLLFIAYKVLQKYMPENLYAFFSITNYIKYDQRTNYAGRLNTLSFIYNNLFEHDFFKTLFGVGIGSSSEKYIYELGKSFSEFGIIGLIFLVAFFISVFLSGFRNNCTSESMISSAFAIAGLISIVVWNCTFTRVTYLVFFTLSLSQIHYKTAISHEVLPENLNNTKAMSNAKYRLE